MSEASDPQVTAVRATTRWIGLGVLSLALFMASMDNTILNVALPTLARALTASNDQLQWTVDSYQVTYAGCLLIAGSLVDRWGRTRTFLSGVAVFGVCSLMAAFAPNVTILIWARGLTGIGAALLTPSTLALVSALFADPRERTAAFAVWSGANGAGAGVGPLLSGLLLEHLHWSSIFLINVPIAMIAVAMGIRYLPRTPGLRRAGSLDWLGAVSSTAALSLVCWAVISAPGLGVTSPLVLTGLVAGGSLMACFIWLESRHPHPILHLGLFRIRRFAVAVAVSGLVTAGGAGAIFVLTQYLQFVLQYGPWATGIRVIPVALAMLAGALSATWVLHRVGLKPLLVGGLVAITAGFGWLATTTFTSTYLSLLPGAVVFGLAAGLLTPAATQAVMDSLPADASGVGSATQSALMQVGSALGVALIGSLLAARYRGFLQTNPAVTGLDAGLRQRVLASTADALDVAAKLPGGTGPALTQAVQRGFIHGMQAGLGVAAAVVLAAAITVMIFFPAHAEDHHLRVADQAGQPD